MFFHYVELYSRLSIMWYHIFYIIFSYYLSFFIAEHFKNLFLINFVNVFPSQHRSTQFTALHWLQENVQEFGGDPTSVTLMGHGTGAACATFLMTSPAVLDGKSINSRSMWTLFSLRFKERYQCPSAFFTALFFFVSSINEFLREWKKFDALYY